MSFAQNKRTDKKGVFNSNKKVCALNHALLISPIYCEAKGNKMLLWKQQPKSPYQEKKKRKKGIKQPVKFD